MLCVNRWWSVAVRTISAIICRRYIETWPACHHLMPAFSTYVTRLSRRLLITCTSIGFGGGNMIRRLETTGWPFVRRDLKFMRYVVNCRNNWWYTLAYYSEVNVVYLEELLNGDKMSCLDKCRECIFVTFCVGYICSDFLNLTSSLIITLNFCLTAQFSCSNSWGYVSSQKLNCWEFNAAGHFTALRSPYCHVSPTNIIKALNGDAYLSTRYPFLYIVLKQKL